MGVLYARVGGAWQPVNFSASDRWNNSWGRVASATVTTSQGGIGTGLPVDVNGLSVSFVPVAGRTYRATVSGMGLYVNAAAGSVDVWITDGSGNNYCSSSGVAPLGWVRFSMLSTPPLTTLTPGVATTIKVRVSPQSGTLSTSQASNLPSSLIVEDVGPVAGAVAIPNPTPAWITLTGLTNGWASYGAGYTAPSYRLMGDVVEMRGLVNNAASLAAGSSLIATLPVGYRPALTTMFGCYAAIGSTYGAMRVDVNNAGFLTYQANIVGVPAYLSLDQVRFSVTS